MILVTSCIFQRGAPVKEVMHPCCKQSQWQSNRSMLSDRVIEVLKCSTLEHKPLLMYQKLALCNLKGNKFRSAQ
jgi:hypothetical protein